MIRVIRSSFHKADNNALASAYGRRLRRLLHPVAAAPATAVALGDFQASANEEAQSAYPTAYTQGKRQVADFLGVLSIADRLWLDREIATHQGYIQYRLIPSILAFIAVQQLALAKPPERLAALDQRFGTRIENLYGGVLWRVGEAGYVSGVKDLSALIQGPEIVSESDKDAIRKLFGMPKPDEKSLEVKAYKPIGPNVTTIVEALRAIADTQIGHSARIGIEYISVGDNRSCVPCQVAEGVYWLPTEPPLPGSVCLGGAECRCFLQAVIDTGE